VQEVELHPAFQWDCDNCGKENFTRSIKWEGSEEDLIKLKERFEIEAWQEGEFRHCPDEVTCSYCGTVFKAKDVSTSYEGESSE
jgi:uncharacterized Zn finger protein